MNSGKNARRILGGLLLVQLTGLIVPFVMLHALNAPPGYLQSAAAGATQIRWALLLLLANGALTVGISVFSSSFVRPSSPSLAMWLVVLGGLMLALQAVDNIQVMAMVSVSQRYADFAGAPAELFGVLGPAAAATRLAAHYSVLLAIGAWMLLFYIALWRARLVPQILPALGILAAALHVAGVSLPVFLGYSSVMQVAPGLAVSHGVLILWLLFGDFHSR